MAAEYPGAIFDDTIGGLKDSTLTQADFVKVVEECRAGLVTLGVNPQGADATVVARLDRIEALLTAFGRVGFRKLIAVNNTGTPNSKVDVSADLLVCEGSVLSGVAVTIDITVAGKNGLSTGSEAASTWYYVWIGHNPSTNEVAGLFDTSVTRAGLTLTHGSLSGFTRWVRVAAVRNNGSSNFLRFLQQDRRVLYPGDDTNTDFRCLSGGLAASFTSVALTKAIPPTSRQALLHAIMTATGGGGDFYALGYTTAFTGAGYRLGSLSAATERRGFLWLPTDGSQNVQYKTSVPGGGLDLDVAGYEDPIG